MVTAIMAEVKPHLAKMKTARDKLQKSVDAAKVEPGMASINLAAVFPPNKSSAIPSLIIIDRSLKIYLKQKNEICWNPDWFFHVQPFFNWHPWPI